MSKRKYCPHGDPLCPCQDGDMCHYEGPDAWPEPSRWQKREWAKQADEHKRISGRRPEPIRAKWTEWRPRGVGSMDDQSEG